MSEPGHPTLSVFSPVLELQVRMALQVFIYRSSGERNSSPHACPISALPTEQSPSHQEATRVTPLSCVLEDHLHGF